MLDKSAAREIALRYATVVRKTMNPKTIVLFGSYVNGVPNENSDIDIAVVFSDFCGNWLDAAAYLCSLKRQVSLDIEPHMMDEASDPSGFLEHIMKTGEIIYEAT